MNVYLFVVYVVSSRVELGYPDSVYLRLSLFFGHRLLSGLSLVAVTAPRRLEENEYVSVKVYDFLMKVFAYENKYSLFELRRTFRHLRTFDGWLQLFFVLLFHKCFDIVCVELFLVYEVLIGCSVGDDNSGKIF